MVASLGFPRNMEMKSHLTASIHKKSTAGIETELLK
jgi:hypothetical protein